MGAVLGLLLGVGLLLVWSSFRAPAAPTRQRDAPRCGRCSPRAGLGDVSVAGFVVVCAVCAVTATAVVLVASRTSPVALVVRRDGRLPAGGGAARVGRDAGSASSPRCGRRRWTTWPRAVRAGMSLPEALVGAVRARPRAAARRRSPGFALDYQVSGRFADALDRLKDRLADPVGDRVVESLRVAREVGGGDLGRLLRSLSGFLRDDARTRSELQSRQAWTVNGARLAVAAPWLVLLLLCFQPEVIQRYSTGAGVVVLVGWRGAVRRRPTG